MEFETISVIGLGTMGHGIAQTIALAGGTVRVFDSNKNQVHQVHQRIASNLTVMLAAEAISEVSVDEVLDRIICCESEVTALHQTDLVIEAIAENLDEKQAFFTRCEASVGSEVILASNTSSFPITEISQGLKDPSRTINTHWFNPPHVIPVVEVIPGTQTNAETVVRITKFLKELGKHPVRVNQELPGFVLNRLQVALFREMLDLVGRGVISAEDLDIAVRGSLGLRWAAVGPMRVGDFGGWDILTKVYEVLASEIRSDTQLPEVLSQMQQQGKLGLKTGQGFFEFPADDRERVISDKDRKFMAWAKVLRESYDG
ncbi:MAG: 3-hydroxyacyl-CoA dehydrogenase family protein [Planctomycetota bacterium]|nr:3-hydroxyacyl-CoA dehydrogenase family protein [Planctomycetota bacterium]